MKQGIILISVRDGEHGSNPYRTGGWCVVKEEAFMKIFQGSAAVQAQQKRVAFIANSVWDEVGLPARGTEVKV
jgi:hypothetical protein